jgi:hypothetical protein
LSFYDPHIAYPISKVPKQTTPKYLYVNLGQVPLIEEIYDPQDPWIYLVKMNIRDSYPESYPKQGTSTYVSITRFQVGHLLLQDIVTLNLSSSLIMWQELNVKLIFLMISLATHGS